MKSLIERKTIDSFPSHEEILDQNFLSRYKGKQPKWGFNGLGYIVFKRTYARSVDPVTRKLLSPTEIDEYKNNGKKIDTEEWNETIERCVRGAQKIGACYTKDEAERLFDHIFNLRCSFAGRGLWQLGTPTVDLIGADSLLNCWVCKVSEIEDFGFIFMESMLGGGVGPVISKEYTHELPRVKKNVRCRLKNTKDADFIIPDSKEGWKNIWIKILEAYLITGKSFTYSTICIRSSGEPIKTFGGIAPGPKPLIDGLEELCRILENREGKKLRTQDVADIICCGGQIVKSGGVRRTALVLQGDVDDAAYLELKRWDLGNIPNYRSNSNNSLICPKFEYLSEKYWSGWFGNGEVYGLVNIPLSRKNGRLGESEIAGMKLYDESIIGGNPCMEALLSDRECCNLAELYINNIQSKEQMLDCAKLLYKTQKAIACCEYLHEETNKIVHKNLRLGLGVTGVCQRLNEFEEWCDHTYRQLREYDRVYSKALGIPQSIRLTVVKPSGTLSLLSGSTPGGHPGFSRYHIRRVRFDSKDKLIPYLKSLGYKIEPEIRFDGTLNHDLLVVEFPASFSESTMISKEMSAVQQLEIVKKLQTSFADQSVSVTIYYKDEEIPDIKNWLKENYNNCVKSVSFLRHSDHGFKQAPLEEIDESQYNQMVKKLKPITSVDDDGQTEIESVECVNGACPIK